MKQKPNYRVGEAAKVLGLSTDTVRKMIDSGRLVGFRLPTPCGTHRRVAHDKLVAYLKANPHHRRGIYSLGADWIAIAKELESRDTV